MNKFYNIKIMNKFYLSGFLYFNITIMNKFYNITIMNKFL